MTRFAKFALSGLTALSLSIAPMSASAAPDGEDVAKALAGLAVLGLIVHSANDRKKKRRASSVQTVTSPYGSIEQGFPSGRVIEGEVRRPGREGNPDSYWKYRARDVALPDQCALIVRTARGDRTAYGKRCLQRNYRHYGELPRDCRLQVRTDRGVRHVYGARCLRRDGWQVARY